ncbi:Hypothetical predicted protein [Pelobates cultripes]|uniref:Uncharacterized protein n=1 Tax=Pelobates cultripes TaxID=61616 RepID=A0AAD1VRX3_PELCU|nr:Hypothetical predicted protein [Pelobates cultripes]
MAMDKSMEQHIAHKRGRISSQRDREDFDSDGSFVEVQSEVGKGVYSSEDSDSVEQHKDIKTIEN